MIFNYKIILLLLINMKPNYLVIGVQKSGTTSMIDYFNQHPQIFMVDDEVHFFSEKKFFNIKNKNKNIKFYEEYLNKKNYKNKRFVGEKTPSYSFLLFSIKNIYNTYPKIKLIMILREPIQRAFSQYMMVCNRKNIKPSNNHFYKTIKSLEKIQLKNITSISNFYYLQRGYYDIQIENIYKYFPKKQLYIGVFEKIIKNQKKEYNKIYKFIGAKEDNSINYSRISRKGEYSFELSTKNKKYLYSFYKNHNEKLYEILGYKINEWEDYYIKKNLI